MLPTISSEINVITNPQCVIQKLKKKKFSGWIRPEFSNFFVYCDSTLFVCVHTFGPFDLWFVGRSPRTDED